MSSPNVGSASQLTSVSASPGAAIVWAAGYSGLSGSFNPLTLRKRLTGVRAVPPHPGGLAGAP